MPTSVSANRKRTSQHRARLAFFHKSFALKTKPVGRLVVETEFSNQVSNFDLSFLDEEQNERTDGRFVPVTDSDVDKYIETEENANTKKKDPVRHKPRQEVSNRTRREQSHRRDSNN